MTSASGSRSSGAPVDRRLSFVIAVLGAGLFVVPLLSLILGAPWARVAEVLRDPITLDALRLSLVVSGTALVLSFMVALPLSWLLARHRFAGRSLLRGIVAVPMLMPPVVGGVALLEAFGRRGLLGALLEDAGVILSLSTAGAVVAAAFVSAPFLVFALEAGYGAVDTGLEDAAATLGASRTRIFRTVTLPALRPAIVAGGALCWARAFGEFGATITFAGNLRGRTQTIPLAVFESLQNDPGASILIALLPLVLAVGLLVLLRRHLSGA
ncbi:MAG: molybdate ABC transporter permease subunit [Actinomycetota bacterium]